MTQHRLVDTTKSVLSHHPWAQRTIRSLRLAIGSVHEQQIKLLPALVDPSLLAIDVGASVGSYTHALLNLGCRVMTFEANPNLVRTLQKMYGHKAEIVWSAVSSSSGHIILRIPQRAGIATVERSNNLNFLPVDEVEVPCVALDERVSERVGFIKIDVEGHELAVLQGAMMILKRDHPVLLIEAEERHRPQAVQSIVEQLTPLGYCGFMLDGMRLVGISHFDLRHDQAVAPEIIHELNGGYYTGRYINNFLFIAG